MTKSATTPQTVGPWRGVNNVELDTAEVYAGDKNNMAMLRSAINVDIDSEGTVSKRAGRTQVLPMTNAHSLYESGDQLYLNNNGALTRVDPSSALPNTKVLATGLNIHADVSYAEAGGQVFWCNGHERGCIANDAWAFWGIEPPQPPVLTATANGGLLPGKYMVALTSSTADGAESGARVSSLITLTQTGGILVGVITPDPNAAYVDIYVSTLNGDELFWVRQEEASIGEVEIQAIGNSRDPLREMGCYPPPPGAHMVQLYRGRLLVAAGDTLYWSQPLAYHLFKVKEDLQMFPNPIVMMVALNDGFYVSDGEVTYWVSGDDPENWTPTEIDDYKVLAGEALVLPGRKFPALKTSDEVAVWASEKGPVVGLSTGQVVHLTEHDVAVQPHKKASLVFREEAGLRQLMMSMHGKAGVNTFGLGDTATATVIKAGTEL